VHRPAERAPLRPDRWCFDYLRSVEGVAADAKRVKEWILEEFRARSRAA